MMKSFTMYHRVIRVSLLALVLMLGSPAFAQLSCVAEWITHGGGVPGQNVHHCEMQIRSDLCSNSAQICGIYIALLKDVTAIECGQFCSREPEILQPDLEKLLFQRMAFMQTRMEGVAQFIQGVEAQAKMQCAVAQARTLHFESRFNAEQQRADEACRQLKETQEVLNSLLSDPQ